MFSKSACIMIAGKMGSGKTLAAKYLMDMIRELHLIGAIIPLALPIKTIAKKYIGWDGEKDEKGRKLLQILGTEAGRTYNPDCWVSYLINKYIPDLESFPLDFVIIDDWRFPNEKDYIENDPVYAVYTIRLYRGKKETTQRIMGILTNHPSENSLPEYPNEYDYSIDNNYDKEFLENELSLILDDILKKHPRY